MYKWGSILHKQYTVLLILDGTQYSIKSNIINEEYQNMEMKLGKLAKTKYPGINTFYTFFINTKKSMLSMIIKLNFESCSMKNKFNFESCSMKNKI